MKLLKNATGIIEIRNSSTNELEKFFDPTGMIVNDHPRASDCVCISKTPSEQDESESITIKLSEVSHVGGVVFAGSTRASLKEALVLLFKKGGGSGEGLQVASVWQRPTDWLPMPAVGANEEVFYALHAVWNSTVNPVALLCTGNYTVDWGDGTITNHNSNTKAEKNYVYSSVTSVVSTLGYKMVMIKVTPQAGQTITLINLQKRHTNFNYQYNGGFLDIYDNFSNAGKIYGAGGDGVSYSYIEKVYIKNMAAGSYTYASFQTFLNLQKLTIKAIYSTLYLNNIFLGPQKLQLVDGDLPAVITNSGTALWDAFYSTRDLSWLTLTNMSPRFYECKSLVKFPNYTNVISLNGMFMAAYAMTEIPAYNCINVTDASSWLLYLDRRIRRSLIYNIKCTHSYANQLMDADAINLAGTNAGTANALASVDFRGNPGYATADSSIWTNKGWTWL